MSDISFREKDKVLAMWDNGEYYPATIFEVKEDRATVQWDDGTGYASVKYENIKFANTNSDFKVGDKVFAVWSDKRYYPATIKSIGDGEATVAWDDGSEDMIVRFTNISYEKQEIQQIQVYELRLSGSVRGKIDANGNVWLDGSQIGKYESNGDVRKNGSIIGSISGDGTVRKNGSIIGSIDSDGTIRLNGSIVGSIDSNGTVRKNGSIIGECGNCQLYQAAGFYFFFFLE